MSGTARGLDVCSIRAAFALTLTTLLLIVEPVVADPEALMAWIALRYPGGPIFAVFLLLATVAVERPS